MMGHSRMLNNSEMNDERISKRENLEIRETNGADLEGACLLNVREEAPKNAEALCRKDLETDLLKSSEREVQNSTPNFAQVMNSSKRDVKNLERGNLKTENLQLIQVNRADFQEKAEAVAAREA